MTESSASAKRRLLLVGGAPAHLYVLRELARRPLPDLDAVLLVAGEEYHVPMMAGYLQGQYSADDVRIDLHGLARAAGVRLEFATVIRIDAERRLVLTDAQSFPFDVCSVAVAADTAGTELQGVSEHAVMLQPSAQVLALRERVDELLASTPGASMVVVGGGARGVEVALALQERLRAVHGSGSVALVEQGAEVLATCEPPLRRLAAAVLRDRGVSVARGGRVVSVSPSGVSLHHGATLPASLVVWAAGAAAPRLFTASGLPVDAAGYLLVDRSLRAVDGSPVWGAGDCVTVRDLPAVTRGGAYGVRDGPALDRSLRAALGHGRRARYRPQRSRLLLLNTGAGWALMRWKGIHRHSRWAWRLKDMIDRRYLRRYRPGDEKSVSAS